MIPASDLRALKLRQVYHTLAGIDASLGTVAMPAPAAAPGAGAPGIDPISIGTAIAGGIASIAGSIPAIVQQYKALEGGSSHEQRQAILAQQLEAQRQEKERAAAEKAAAQRSATIAKVLKYGLPIAGGLAALGLGAYAISRVRRARRAA